MKKIRLPYIPIRLKLKIKLDEEQMKIVEGAIGKLDDIERRLKKLEKAERSK